MVANCIALLATLFDIAFVRNIIFYTSIRYFHTACTCVISAGLLTLNNENRLGKDAKGISKFSKAGKSIRISDFLQISMVLVVFCLLLRFQHGSRTIIIFKTGQLPCIVKPI